MQSDYKFAAIVIGILYVGYWIYNAITNSRVSKYIQERQAQKRAEQRARELAEIMSLSKEIEDAKIDYDAAKRKLNEPSDS